MSEEIKITYDHPDPSENNVIEKIDPLFIADGNTLSAIGTLSESEAFAVIMEPENRIEGFVHRPTQSFHNWGDKNARRKYARVAGDFIEGGHHFAGSIEIYGPGFIRQSIARIRGKDIKMNTFYNKNRISSEKYDEHRR
jgi:hypothetical protein